MGEAEPKGVLIVDDEAALRAILANRLERLGFQCFEAGDSRTAMGVLRQAPDIGVVLVDVRMPGESGLDFIAAAKQDASGEREFVVMTGAGGMDEAIQALRLGARDFLQKPLRFEQVEQAIRDGFQTLAKSAARRRTQVELERCVEKRTWEIQALVHEIDNVLDDAMETLVAAAEHRDDETGMHIRRIGAYARELASGLGCPAQDVDKIASAAMLHDIGKIGVPDSILLKPGPLTDCEFATMRHHTSIGHQIMVQSHSRVLGMAAEVALHHHERWDGTGYPHGLAGLDIPLAARITAVCDVYDALRSKRPYKGPIDHSGAMEIILGGDARTQPQHFDPELLSVLARRQAEFAKIFETLPETHR